jgi:hypothetical protein
MCSRFGLQQWRVAFAVVTLLTLWPLAEPVHAGQGSATASIVGQVTDESKGVLPGVTVTATSPSLQVPQVIATTDDRGEYRLTPLPIGVYTVEYSLTGFRSVRQEGVRLTAGFTAKLDVSLGVGALEETVTVSGAAPLVDTNATETVTHITREVLENIPTGRSGYIGLMQLAPGARPPLDVGGSTNNQNPTFRAFGMVGEAWQALDGVVTKNPRASDSGNYFDFNAFEEASVATLGHDATVPNRGVVIDSVIKSGGNEFHGGGFYGGTSSAFQSEAAEEGDRLKLRDDLNGELGGRIVQNKLWFWIGDRNQRSQEEVSGCFKPDGSPCVHENNAKFVTPKVTFQLSPSNKLIGFAALGFRDDIESLGGPLIAWSARRHQTGFQGASKGEWQAVKGDSLVMNVLAGLFWNHSGTICDAETCDQTSARDRATGEVFGLINRAGERNREGRRQVRANMSWFRPDWAGGNHELKAGFDFFHAPANRIIDDRGAAHNWRLNFNRGNPDRVELWNYPVRPDNAIRQIYVYAADSWSIGRKLTLNIGARYGYESAYENAGCREPATAPLDGLFPAMCWDRLQMPVFHSIVPRLRAVYDLTGNGRTVIKGGWGRYMSLRLFDYMQPMLSNVPTTATFRWRDLNGNRNWDAGESNLNLNGTDFLSLSLAGQFTALGRGVVNPEETQPYTDEYSIQLERQLTSDIAVRLTGVHTRALNQYRLANDLRPYESYNIPITSPDPGPDGRIGTPDDTGNAITWFDYPASLAGVNFQRGMIVNDDRANQKYNSMEFAVSKRLSSNWQFQATYTATHRNVPLEPNADIWNTQDPNAEIFAENKNWEWQSRFTGSYLFPHDILFSGNFEHRSGDPWARTALLGGGRQIPDITLLVEPIGSRRLPNINLLSVRAEKRFSLWNRQQLQVRTNVFNLLNTTVETAVNALSGPSFGTATATVLPRIVNFEVQYRF